MEAGDFTIPILINNSSERLLIYKQHFLMAAPKTKNKKVQEKLRF